MHLMEMTLSQILTAWSQTLVDIMNDLILGQPVIASLLREDRLIYVGLTLIVAAFLVDA